LTAALQDLAAFAGTTCATVGHVYALIHSHSLAQQLANRSINLCSALDALAGALAGLGPSQELQEDLGQLLRQMGRGLSCSYSESQHRLLLELYIHVGECFGNSSYVAPQQQLPSQ
jgi:hypothetical protein